jgi:hypothetical protein
MRALGPVGSSILHAAGTATATSNKSQKTKAPKLESHWAVRVEVSSHMDIICPYSITLISQSSSQRESGGGREDILDSWMWFSLVSSDGRQCHLSDEFFPSLDKPADRFRGWTTFDDDRIQYEGRPICFMSSPSVQNPDTAIFRLLIPLSYQQLLNSPRDPQSGAMTS